MLELHLMVCARYIAMMVPYVSQVLSWKFRGLGASSRTLRREEGHRSQPSGRCITTDAGSRLIFFLLEVGLAEELEEERAEGLEEELVVATPGSALRGGLGGVLYLRLGRRQDGGVVRRCRPAASSTCSICFVRSSTSPRSLGLLCVVVLVRVYESGPSC